jgi:cytochrome P450
MNPIPPLWSEEFARSPHPPLRRLRDERPVAYDSSTDLWLVSRYGDVRAVLLDPDTYRPDNALTAVTPLSVSVLRRLASLGFALPCTLANNGTATHPALRRLVAGFFTRRRVAAMAPLVEAWAHECVDRAEQSLDRDGRCDLVAEVAKELPARVLLHLLDIQGVDIATLKIWSAAALELFWGNPEPARQSQIAEEAAGLHRFLQRRVRDSYGRPAHGLLGELARCRVDGRRLSLNEAVGVCYFLLIAGQETTTQLLSTAYWRLIASSTLWRQVTVPAFAATAVEEVLRREPPVTTWRRRAARASVLAGVPIPAQAQLLLMLAGAGSDPEAFDDPERFDPLRADAHRHLAFGLGAHRCLGASLARLETAVAVRVTALRLPDLEADPDTGEPEMLSLLSFRAPQSVWVRRTAIRAGT